MFRRIRRAGLTHVTLGILVSLASPARGDQTVQGSLSTTQAYAFRGDQQELSLSRYDAKLSAKTEGKHCGAKVNLRLRSDSFLNPSSSTNLAVREGVVTCRRSRMLYSFGEQSVVWGKADGFHVLDAVESFDYTEFFLDDPNDARIPLLMGRVEYRPNDDDMLQVLITPDRRNDILPRNGGRFAPAWAPQVALASLSTEAPKPEMSDVRNWEYGAQWETTSHRVDYSLNYLNKWASEPSNTYTAPLPSPVAADYRQQIFGGSFELPVSTVVARGEAIYTPATYLPASTATLPLVTLPYSQIGFVTGLDYQAQSWFVSAQLFQSLSSGNTIAPIGGRSDSIVTLLATQSFDQGKTSVRLFGAQDVKNGGEWLSASVNWQLVPRYSICARADAFAGPQSSIFGRIRAQDRVSVSVTRTF